MDEVEIENSTNPENLENDQPQKAKYAIQVIGFRRFQFRRLKIKGSYEALRNSITLISNHLK